MLSSARKRLVIVFVFFFCAVIAAVKFGPVSKGQSVPDGTSGPVITATDQDSITTDVDGDGRADPGDTVQYTVIISNTGADATGMSFIDTLSPNMTIVGGSLTVTPITIADTYTATGNVRITTPDGATDLLANDINPATGTSSGLTVTTGTFSSTNCPACGNVVITANDGSFAYNPPAGFEGTDTFTYTVNGFGGATSTGTATITVSGMIWFVNSAAAAGGNGTLLLPFNCLVGAGCFNGSANDPGDNIFLYTGNYTGGLTLKNTQRIIGQAATASLISVTGLTLAPNSDALPATGGVAPTVTTAIAATSAFTLGTGNTMRGFNIGTVTAFHITGSNFGTLTVADMGMSGNGGLLNLTNGTLAATFGGLVSGLSPAQGIVLSSVGGSMTAAGTTVSNPTT